VSDTFRGVRHFFGKWRSRQTHDRETAERLLDRTIERADGDVAM
jgi:hypothetical protein